MGAQRQVDTLTSQMDEANPVLTQISDAMTKEGEALDVGDTALAATWCVKKKLAMCACRRFPMFTKPKWRRFDNLLRLLLKSNRNKSTLQRACLLQCCSQEEVHYHPR